MTSKRDRILDSAAKLFSKYGPRKTTIDEIATESGIAKGTVYLSFTSKEEIFQAVGRREIDLVLTELRRGVRSETTAISKLEKFLNTRFAAEDDIRKKFGTTREVIKESHALPQSEKLREEFYAGELHIIRDILELGIDTGAFKKIKDIDKTSRALSNLMQGLEKPWDSVDGNQFLVSDKVGLFLDLVLMGLAPRD